MFSTLIPSVLIACSLLFGSFIYMNRGPIEEEATTPIEEFEKFESEIWFDELGCFNIGHPWKTPLRPVPPPMGPDENPAFVHFYSWRKKSKSYVITLYPEIHVGGAPFDASLPTAIIIHGYRVNVTELWILHLKDAYLNNVKANVLLTDWGPGSATGILQASSNTRVVAKLMVRLLKHLIRKRGLRKEQIHLIGHSLGAHVAGYIAKEIHGIPRLTALDPAQLPFEGYDKEVRLDKSDAAFVEVVHTNARPFVPDFGLGMVKPLGHVDFYFNDGSHQPGCILPDVMPQIHSLGDVLRFPLDYNLNLLTCSHGRAHEYLIEAYNKTNNCIFWGRKATAEVNVNSNRQVDKQIARLYFNFTVHPRACTKENCIPFGLETIDSPLRGVFVVRTNSHPPFCIFESLTPSNES